MKDYAFLKTGSGQIICGLGPFAACADPPTAGVAFYLNDFRLGDSRPWKVPQAWFMASDLRELRNSCTGFDEPRVEWNPPEAEHFASVFARIKEEIRKGAFQKLVPVLIEQGHLRSGHWEALFKRVERLPEPFFSYGCRLGGDVRATHGQVPG